MLFAFSPHIPYYFDPRLREINHAPPIPAASDPKPIYLPVGTAAPPKLKIAPSTSPDLHPQLPLVVHCSDVRHEHKLNLSLGDANTGLPANSLLSHPVATAEEIECPICEAKVKMWQPLENRIKEIVEKSGQENPYLVLKMDHPAHISETKTAIPDNAVKARRYYRYAPVSTPPVTEVPGAERLLALYSHEHALIIRAVEASAAGQSGVRLAQDWLSSEYAKAGELKCAWCQTALKLDYSLEEYLKNLAEAEGGADKVFLEWSLIHPDEIPVPANAVKSPFKLVRLPKASFWSEETSPPSSPYYKTLNSQMLTPPHNPTAALSVREHIPMLALVKGA
jgi:hypothetical protein